MRKRLYEILNEKFAMNSNFICEIKVHKIDEEEYENGVDRELKYDIMIYLNVDLLKVYNHAGSYGLRLGVIKKVTAFLNDWMGLNPQEYFLGTSSKECGKGIKI